MDALLPALLTRRKKIACHRTPPVAPPALTRPHTTPLDLRDTNGTTPYTVPHVICGRQLGSAGGAGWCARTNSRPQETANRLQSSRAEAWCRAAAGRLAVNDTPQAACKPLLADKACQVDRV